MKTIFFSLCMVIILLNVHLMALETKNKITISLSGGPGMVLATGFLPDPEIHGSESSTGVGPGGVIGLNFGYNFFNSTISKYNNSIYAIFGAEAAFKNVYVNFEFPHGDGEAIYKTSFFNFLFGARGIAGWMYYELGFFYGIEMAEWRYKYDGDYITDINEKIPGINSDNEFGIFLGFGAAFPVIEKLTIDAGIQFQFGLTSIIESTIPDTDMNEISILLKLGATYKF